MLLVVERFLPNRNLNLMLMENRSLFGTLPSTYIVNKLSLQFFYRGVVKTACYYSPPYCITYGYTLLVAHATRLRFVLGQEPGDHTSEETRKLSSQLGVGRSDLTNPQRKPRREA